MSVKIDLDLRAGDVEGEILAIATALQTLDDKSNDVDVGDSIDADGITGSIGEVITKLEDFEADVDKISTRIDKKLQKIDVGDVQTELVHKYKSEDSGSTNKGDSTGSDPPTRTNSDIPGVNDDNVGLRSKEKIMADAKGELNKHSTLKNAFDDHVVMGEDFMAEWFDKPRAGRTGLEGPIPKDGDRRILRQSDSLGTNSDFSAEVSKGSRSAEFGLDPDSMDWKRMGDSISIEEFLGKSSGSSDSLIDKLVPKQEELLENAGLSPTKIGQRNGFDFGELSERQQDKLLEESGIDSSVKFDRFGNRKSSLNEFNDEQIEKMRGPANRLFNKDDLTSGRSRTTFRDLNTDLRAQSGGLTDAEIDAASSRSFIPTPDTGNDSSLLDAITPENMNKGFSKMGGKLKSLTPSMGQYMQLLAAIIPMLVTFAVQALGVAAALGAVGAAGASLIGLGLLGHGESMGESFAKAKEQMRELKKEMFNAGQPLMQTFAPIQARMFDAIPEGMDGIFEEMEGLAAFEGTLFNLGSAFSGGVEEFFAIINRNAGAIDQLSRRFGGLIGTEILNFFEFLIQEADSSQGLLVRLGDTFVILATAAYELSKFISKIVVAFRPLAKAILFVSELMSNDLVAAFIIISIAFGSFLILSYKVLFAINALSIALAGLGGSGVVATIVGGLAKITGMLWGLIVAAWEANAALGVLAGLATLGLGLGAAFVGYEAIQGMKPDKPGGSKLGGIGGGGTYNDNRSYKIETTNDDYATQKSIGHEIEKKSETTKAQAIPDVTTNSTSADSEDK